MKSVLKYLVFDIFYYLLLLFSFDKILRTRSTNKLLIIMYHGVSEKSHGSINGRHLLASQFEKQLKYFKGNFKVVSLNEICQMKNNNIKPDKHTIALTFDDGFLNNLRVALPLLKKYKLPATFFPCSISLKDQKYIHPADHLDLIRAANNLSIEMQGERFVNSKGNLVRYTDKTPVIQYVNSLASTELEAFLFHLQNTFKVEDITVGVDEEVYKLLDENQLKDLSLDPYVTIGSHCFTHVNITQLEPNEMIEQLTLSKKQLEAVIRKPVNAIAFPYGCYNQKAIELSKITGYHYLIAGGEISQEFKDDVFPRIGVVSAGSYAQNILSINAGFRRFGF